MQTRIIQKTYEHISLDEAKDQLRISKNFLDDDAYILGVIQAASEMAGNYIENHIALTALQTKAAEFSGTEIRIDQGNFHALDTIIYTDRYGLEKILSFGEGYTVEAEEFKFSVKFSQHIDAKNLTLNYKCGFDSETILPVIRQAILIKITDLYDVERSSYTAGSFQLNKAFEALLSFHKKVTIC